MRSPAISRGRYSKACKPPGGGPVAGKGANMLEPLGSVDELTPARLTEALRCGGALGRGCVEQVVVAERGETPWSSIYHLEASYSADAPGDAPTRLFLKIGGGGAGEAAFYRSVAELGGALPVPPCYEAVYASTSDRSHFLLLDLAQTHGLVAPWPLPPLRAQGEEVAACLARLHAAFWQHPRLGKGIARRRDYFESESNYRGLIGWWQESYCSWADFMGDRLTAEERGLYERLLSGMPGQWSRYWQERAATGRGLTLIHGDCHPGNLLYPHDPARYPIYLVDWQGYCVGTGATDLAYMVTGHWYAEKERALPFLRRYHAALGESGVAGYPWEALWLDYRAAVLHYMFDPIRLHTVGVSPEVWWPILRRCLAAFHELDCMELLA